MTGIYEMYETDHGLENEGFDHMVSPEGKDKDGKKVKAVVFTLARAGGSNTPYQKTMEKQTRPHRRAMKNDDLDNDLALEMLRTAFATTIILGWSGVVGKDDKEIKWSPTAAKKLLDELPDLFDELREAASSMANFRAEQIEDDSGN